MLSEGMKQLFQREKEWAAEGVTPKPSLYDIYLTFHSFMPDDIARAARVSVDEVEGLCDELYRLQQKHGERALVSEVEAKESINAENSES